MMLQEKTINTIIQIAEEFLIIHKCITYSSKQQDDYDYSIIDKIYLNVKDSNKVKYQCFSKNYKTLKKMILKI